MPGTSLWVKERMSPLNAIYQAPLAVLYCFLHFPVYTLAAVTTYRFRIAGIPQIHHGHVIEMVFRSQVEGCAAFRF